MLRVQMSGVGASLLASIILAGIAGCGGGTTTAPPPTVTNYTLTIASTNPASGVGINVSPSVVNVVPSGQTPFSVSFAQGTAVTLTAPAMAGLNTFSAWTGCDKVSTNVCTVTVKANTTVTAAYLSPPPVYTLTVNSTNPANGVAIAASPADNNSISTGKTSFTLSYTSGATVKLTAPSTAGSNSFGSWTGCSSVSANVCTVQVGGNTTVTAAYNSPPNGVTGVTVSPATHTVIIGTGQQFAATVSGNGTYDSTVTWSVTANGGSTLDPGTITSKGYYQSPYPAPAGVTVTATSNGDATKSGTSAVTLSAPATAAGPALSVDAAAQNHAISPLIYGMNQYQLDPSIAAKIGLPIDRWGGDGTTRYNYQLDISNAANDYYFEQFVNDNTGYPDVSQFNSQVVADEAAKTKTVATVPLIGYTTKRQKACSYSITKYGAQPVFDPYWTDCGNGAKADGTRIVNDPADTSVVIDENFVSGWVKYLVNRYGTAANGGVYEYQMDNEPEFWSAVHPDVHPASSTYDEITNKGLTYAGVVKTADPTAMVGGPSISYWDGYYYSWADLVSGWGTGPCYCFNGNPTDRKAHGNVPLLEYYLQQFKKSEDQTGVRLLDYLDLHGYYAASNTAFALAGDTALQQSRLASTRSMWDSTYLDGYADPNSVSQNPQQQAVELIPRMKQWVATDYPGTKTAVMEYNWGGQEHINGALAQADLLGIFGREGLDMAALWGPPDPVKQLPGLTAYLLYKNYDGAGSTFGDMSLTSTSADQGQLAVYGATRTNDGEVTIVVINKSYGDLTSQLTLAHGPSTAVSVKVFQYSNANLNSIVSEPSATLAAPATPGGSSVLSVTFPASSMTLLVVPKS